MIVREPWQQVVVFNSFHLYPFVVVPGPGTWRRTSVYSYRGLALLMPPLLR